MTTKKISLVVLSLSVCTLAWAAEYKTPAVAFKGVAPSHKETKMVEFNEEYKVEGAVKTDRQIASEADSTERDPSSVVVEDIKHDDMKTEEKFEPKPWLYKKSKTSAN